MNPGNPSRGTAISLDARTEMETAEQTAAVLAWQDRWINRLDDVFLDGAALLDHTVAYSATNVPKDPSGRPRSVGEVVVERIQDWSAQIVQPHLRLAWMELGLAVGRPLPVPKLPDPGSVENAPSTWTRPFAATLPHWRSQSKSLTFIGRGSLREVVLDLVRQEAQHQMECQGRQT